MRGVFIEVPSESHREKVPPDYRGENNESPVLRKVSCRVGKTQDRCEINSSGRTHAEPVDGNRREQSKHGTVREANQ